MGLGLGLVGEAARTRCPGEADRRRPRRDESPGDESPGDASPGDASPRDVSPSPAAAAG